jgi:hypothetical protein
MDEVSERLGFEPVFPPVRDIDPRLLWIGYDGDADSLMVYFYGKPLPAVSVDVNPCVYLRVDPVSHAVVGLQIEGFLARAVREDPRLLEFAGAAGLSDDEIEAIRRGIDATTRQRVALRSLLGELATSAAREPATTEA